MAKPFTASSFRAKLILTAGVFVLTITALGVLLYVSAERYQYHLERSVAANNVLSSFQSVSDHTYRKLNAVGQIVATQYIGNVDARLANERQLWAALEQTQFSLEREATYDVGLDNSGKFNRLAEIESIVEQIIEGGADIRQAVQAGEQEIAQVELTRLQSAGIAGKFNRLIDEAIREEREIVSAIQADAIALGEFISRFLPAAILITLVLGSIAAVTISRSLNLSLTQLRTAAEAYTSGNLDHRSFNLPDAEFNQLADAFNRMAIELTARRAEAIHSQEQLENQVQERTQELSHTLGQLRMADATRRRFLADISHELRTPLTLIQGEAEMVMRGADRSAEDYREALTRVRDQAIQTTRLVKDLLLIARAEEGNLHMERRSLDLTALLQDACADFRSALLKKNLVLHPELPGEPIRTMGDPDRLRQVFAIALDNAIRYSDTDEEISMSLTDGDGHAKIKIRDRGAKLNQDESNKAFERFFRGDEAAQKSDGSGLGLPVAKAIVEAHHGKIELNPESDGVTLIVHLPIQQVVEEVA
ncbi:MAG: ATP-binding protein [Pseudomonadota bacterium]